MRLRAIVSQLLCPGVSNDTPQSCIACSLIEACHELCHSGLIEACHELCHSTQSTDTPQARACVPNAAPLAAHEHLWIYDEFIITCETVKMTSFPTAISGVFHEPMSFRFNTARLNLAALVFLLYPCNPTPPLPSVSSRYFFRSLQRSQQPPGACRLYTAKQTSTGHQI